MDSATKLMQKIKVKGARLNRLSKQITVELDSGGYLMLGEEKHLIEHFKKHFNTDNLRIKCSAVTIPGVDESLKGDIIDRMTDHCPTLLPYRDKISMTIAGEDFLISFPDICRPLLNATDTIRFISEFISSSLMPSASVNCKFIENGNGKDEYRQIKKELEGRIKKENKDIKVSADRPAPKAENKVNSYSRRRTASVVRLSELDEGSDRVAFICEVIKTEVKDTKSGKKLIIFDVTDYTSSVTCKLFAKPEEMQELDGLIVPGGWLEIEGRYEYNGYDKEYVVMVRKLNETEPVNTSRADNAEKKRVELHLHTKMSSKDGFIEVKKLFRELAEWGHTAVAVTDHGVVQAYPEIASQAAKYGIKPLYGVEGYLVDDGRAVMHNPDDGPLDGRTVIYAGGTEYFEYSDGSAGKPVETDDAAGLPGDAIVICTADAAETIPELTARGTRVVMPGALIEKLAGSKPMDEKENIDSPAKAAAAWQQIVKNMLEEGVDTLNKLCVRAADASVNKDMRQHHVIIIAKNQSGLKNLYELISYSHISFFYKKPRIPKSILDAKRRNIFIGSACEAGELYRAVVAGADDHVLEETAGFYDYLEIQPVGNNAFMAREGVVDSEEAIRVMNRKVDSLGERLGIPVAATCDAHFLTESDGLYRKIIMHGMNFKDVETQAPLYLRTTDEMLDEFSYLGIERAQKAVVEVPAMIADGVEKIIPIPKETFPPSIEGSDEELRKICTDRLTELYGENPHEKITARMNKELDSIINNGFSVMYIISQKLSFKSLEDGYLVGSRGSVGSSFAAFLTRISEVNPLEAHYICRACMNIEFADPSVYDCGIDMPDKKCPVCGSDYEKDGFDIPFETFLGFDGDKMPDIDQNFSGEYQATAHKYVEELFGSDNVFKAGTISTFAEKTAAGFVRGYLEENSINCSKAEFNRLTKGCEGVKRTTGQHPGGMVVLPQGYSINDFTPVQRPANDPDSDMITTHFDFNSMHDTLLKLDILGHDDPTVIKMLQDLTGVDPKGIDIRDEKIISLFSSTDALEPVDDIGCDLGVLGIPEFGTVFVRGMLRTAVPTTVSELIKLSGLSHGTNVWNNNAEDLIKNGVATLQEVISIRDNIMLYLIHKGVDSAMAFEITEKVRKGNFSDKYESIMFEHGVPQWYVDSCNKIEYMFPKAHAAAYVIMALRIAWYKIYYPKAYYTAYFSIRADEFDVDSMYGTIGECRARKDALQELIRSKKATAREQNLFTILEIVVEMLARGIHFKPVDINFSLAEKFICDEDGIRIPLAAVGGIGQKAAAKVIEERDRKQFATVDDLRARGKLTKTAIEKLREIGALGDMPQSSQTSFFD